METKQTRREKPIQQKQKAGIVMSLNDTTLAKVTYGKYATRVPDEVVYGIYEWFSMAFNVRQNSTFEFSLYFWHSML